MPNSAENFKNIRNYTAYHGVNYGDRIGCPPACCDSLDLQRNYCRITKHESDCTYTEAQFESLLKHRMGENDEYEMELGQNREIGKRKKYFSNSNQKNI